MTESEIKIQIRLIEKLLSILQLTDYDRDILKRYKEKLKEKLKKKL